MAVDPISPDMIGEVLHALRYGQSLLESPLIHLDLVTLQLSADGLADTPQSRAWALGKRVHDMVWQQLLAQRGPGRVDRGPDATPYTDFQRLGEDLESGNTDRAAWGLLYFRYLSTGHRPLREVTDRYGVPRRTIVARLARARELLAPVMMMSEVEAARRLADAPRATVDRIVVDETTEKQDEIEVLGALRRMIRTQRLTLRVSSSQLEDASRYPPNDLVGYRLGRIAEWSQPRYRLDSRFVELSLLVDLGEEAQSGRWHAKEVRFADLRDVLAAVDEPAVVLLGPPGAGKSTLLRRLELDLAVDALSAETGEGKAPITFLVSLNQYRPPVLGGPPPDPYTWLVERWATRCPNLAPLDEMLAAGDVVLLVDGLNEMPHSGPDDYRERVLAWKRFLHDRVAAVPGNRMVVACRSLDYSAPLSTPGLRVPQVQMESLNDEKVRDFLSRYSPDRAEEIWAGIEGTQVLETVRWPFFLRLLVEQAAETGEVVGGLVELFTGFVRRALAREVERDNPLFAPGALLDARDYHRIAGGRGWRTPWALPECGALIPGLSKLAYEMQVAPGSEETSQVRVDYDVALGMVGDGHGADVVAAGVALGVLDEDHAANEVMFGHQLVQEYFAARQLAREPEPERVAVPWQISDIQPGLREILDTLPLAETLPALPQTGWEETTILTAAMVPQPELYLRALMAESLVVAARAANVAVVQARLSPAFLVELRWALVARSRDPRADLRARIDAGLALGWLGDPRYERREGPHGAYLWPPSLAVPGGLYPIGDDEPIHWQVRGLTGDSSAHVPRHAVKIAPFTIAQFPVTNAEYACFLAAGGYDDERWWDTDDGRCWRLGELANEGLRSNSRMWRRRYLADPKLFRQMVEEGRVGGGTEEGVERWTAWLSLDEPTFEAALEQHCRASRAVEPRLWRDERYNNPLQPVVGVSWYEVRAYCAWLSAQSGAEVRLPTEVEWEAAARGMESRAYAWGDGFDRLSANVRACRVMRTTPVGVFPEGDTGSGVADMCGNVSEWTASLYGEAEDEHAEPQFVYPYNAGDGREDCEAPPAICRVLRGGSWFDDQMFAQTACRCDDLPDVRSESFGFRVVLLAAPISRGR